MSEQRTIVVIGAGIVGTLAAWRLRREGHAVALLDPEPPGSGASAGNAGCLSPSSILPLAGPGVIGKLPGWLMDRNGPLAIRWRRLPWMLPWLTHFIRAGSGERVAGQAKALAALLSPSLPSFIAWSREIGAPELVRADGSLVVYRSEVDWAGDERARRARREAGIAFSEVDANALRELDPALGPAALRGLHFPDNGHSVDPRGLVEAFARAFEREGGKLRRTRATGFQLRSDRLLAVETEDGPEPADIAILAAGAHSTPLAKAAGLAVPLESERGYHVMIPRFQGGPRLPTVDASARIVATPMSAELRLAGIVEFAGLQAPPDWRRARAVAERARQLYPALPSPEPMTERQFWMGHRPSLPDSLPAIGRAPRCREIMVAFGHGHLGLTAAPRTADLLVQLVAGRLPSIELTPFDPSRFA